MLITRWPQETSRLRSSYFVRLWYSSSFDFSLVLLVILPSRNLRHRNDFSGSGGDEGKRAVTAPCPDFLLRQRNVQFQAAGQPCKCGARDVGFPACTTCFALTGAYVALHSLHVHRADDSRVDACGQGRGGEGTQPYAWHQTCADFLLRCVALPMLTPEI
ncbi:hypothetical protein C0Q70_18322 [Pomacea canaliculata]|uniref:Uncharacterized protein n=1 Tax=Pomacea canaliculata TaxID=400727 RepID=A0A2T7NMW7_POMCA|nr:hypothetical protein C0Q70_18322 [Pomacea canaliculata]